MKNGLPEKLLMKLRLQKELQAKMRLENELHVKNRFQKKLQSNNGLYKSITSECKIKELPVKKLRKELQTNIITKRVTNETCK